MLIQWGSDRQRVWAQSNQQEDGGDWVVVVHGGAWYDAKISHESAFNLFESLNPRQWGGFASIDYRLTPSVVHPAHMEDVERGIIETIERFHPRSIVLVGHSCGAFLCGQVCSKFSKYVAGIVVVEGIYDLDSLVAEYPAYGRFVNDAFGSAWPTVDWENAPVSAIVHSKQDELLSLRQPEWLASRIKLQPFLLAEGKHDEVYEQLCSKWCHLLSKSS